MTSTAARSANRRLGLLSGSLTAYAETAGRRTRRAPFPRPGAHRFGPRGEHSVRARKDRAPVRGVEGDPVCERGENETGEHDPDTTPQPPAGRRLVLRGDEQGEQARAGYQSEEQGRGDIGRIADAEKLAVRKHEGKSAEPGERARPGFARPAQCGDDGHRTK